MQASLGCETAYVILDCTQSGTQCRTLVAALAYHETVLPLAWQSLCGKKGHVKGEFQNSRFAHCGSGFQELTFDGSLSTPHCV